MACTAALLEIHDNNRTNKANHPPLHQFIYRQPSSLYNLIDDNPDYPVEDSAELAIKHCLIGVYSLQ